MGKKPKHKALSMANWIKGSNFNFLKYTKVVVLVAVVIILIGGYAGIAKRQTILGMDFTAAML